MTAEGDLDTVEVLRGDVVESRHAVAWCLVRDGVVVRESGPGAAATPTFVRSAVKPLQAMPAVRAGVIEALGLDDRHLAVACASHGGWDEHVVAVTEILVAAGVPEEALGCGASLPRDPLAAAAHATGPARIRHNCSGKHALGLALCVHLGWPLEGYWAAGHPLQEAMRTELAADLGVPADRLSAAPDGCGMQTYAVPLAALARSFGELPPDPSRAMRAHPHLVAFPGAIDTELMRGVPGLVAKIGAEGVLALGLPERRTGLAIKVLDGALRALDPAGVGLARAVLGVEGATPELALLAEPPLLNSRGDRCGRLRLAA